MAAGCSWDMLKKLWAGSGIEFFMFLQARENLSYFLLLELVKEEKAGSRLRDLAGNDKLRLSF